MQLALPRAHEKKDVLPSCHMLFCQNSLCNNFACIRQAFIPVDCEA